MSEHTEKRTAMLIWLKQEGLLKELYILGIITPKAYKMHAARVKVHELMTLKVPKPQAVARAAKIMGVTVRTMYNYLY